MKIAGKIVVCDRGVNARVDKSLAVKKAGGVGMISTTRPGTLDADLHFVPTVHVRTRTVRHIEDTLRRRRGDRHDQRGHVGRRARAGRRRVSSRGPSTPGGGDLMKPDVIGPGQGRPGRDRAVRDGRARLQLLPAVRRCRARTWPASRRC